MTTWGASDEQKHPRAPGGRFGSKPSSSAPASRAVPAAAVFDQPHHRPKAAVAKKAAKRKPALHLGPGAHGTHVAQLQTVLRQLGLGSMRSSGQWDQSTTMAVKAAQERLGLPQTGVANMALIRKVQAAVALSPCIKRSRESALDVVRLAGLVWAREASPLKDAEGHFHAPRGTGIGGQFVSVKAALDALTPDERKARIEDEIKRAYGHAARIPGEDWVSLHRLRSQMPPDMPRDEVDAALLRLSRVNGVTVVPEANHAVTGDDRAAAVVIGGTPKHAIRIESQLIGARHLPQHAPISPARQAEVDGMVRRAYSDTASGPDSWVRLARMRTHLDAAGASRHEQDDALTRLSRRPGVTIVPEANRKSLLPEDVSGSVIIGGRHNHAIRMAADEMAQAPAPAAPPKLSVVHRRILGDVAQAKYYESDKRMPAATRKVLMDTGLIEPTGIGGVRPTRAGRNVLDTPPAPAKAAKAAKAAAPVVSASDIANDASLTVAQKRNRLRKLGLSADEVDRLAPTKAAAARAAKAAAPKVAPVKAMPRRDYETLDLVATRVDQGHPVNLGSTKLATSLEQQGLIARLPDGRHTVTAEGRAALAARAPKAQVDVAPIADRMAQLATAGSRDALTREVADMRGPDLARLATALSTPFPPRLTIAERRRYLVDQLMHHRTRWRPA